MISRADSFLEGFKLGSLGAGKKKIVEPIPKKKVWPLAVMKEHETIATDGRAYPYLLWYDTDGVEYKMSLAMHPINGKAYFIIDAYDEESFKQVVSKEEKPYDTGIALFDVYSRMIKQRGINGLVENFKHLFKPTSGNEARFEKWIKVRKQELGI